MDATTTRLAAEIIAGADALLITAGAGMGVDSGLPDFRGNEGFWNAYPAYRNLGRSFVEMANPVTFEQDPAFAWGFYGHRLNLYRDTEPHAGFSLLRKWAEGKQGGAFVMTSNVDGHFQKAGFPSDRIHEVHGSIHHLQCTTPCRGSGIRSAETTCLTIDEETMRAIGSLPRCPECGAVARPNILMFGDWSYRGERNREQEARMQQWLAKRSGQALAILEIGAGTAVPTVRMFSEELTRRHPGATLLRINPREPEVPRSNGHLSVPENALAALERLEEELEAR